MTDEKIEATLADLKTLKKGKSSWSPTRPSNKACAVAQRLLKAFSLEPIVCTAGDGTIGIEWRVDGETVLIAVGPRGKIEGHA